MTAPDVKLARRVRDPRAVAAARLSGPECAACGAPAGSIHHVLPRGQGGDDVGANLVPLCGHGSDGCHGAVHGIDYLVRARSGLVTGRRDRAWVAERLLPRLLADEPLVAYLAGRLGSEAMARDWLARKYGP